MILGGWTVFAVFILLGFLNHSAWALPQKVGCATGLMPVATQLKATQWRHAITHALDSGSFVSTSIEREARMRLLHVYQEDWIKLQKDTPEFRWVSAPGVQEDWIVKPGGENIPQVVISGLGDSGQLRGTIMLPVSGHTGIKNARQWATTDRYTLYLESELETTTLVLNARSLDLITFHEIEFQPPAKRIARITYHRSGSLGPSGYLEGRILELIWDGT